MPVSTLNRIVSMFIVGGVPIVWYVLRQPQWPPLVLPDSAVLTGVILIPVTAIFGVAAEALAHWWREWAIKPVSNNRRLATRYGQERQFHHLQKWRAALEHLMKVEMRINVTDEPTSNFAGLPSVKLDDYAAGVLLSKGSKEQVDWISAHHSSYALASALATMCFCVGAVELIYQVRTGAACWLPVEAAVVVGLCYLMSCFAVNMWLYSYVLCCRFAVLQRLDKEPGA